MGNPHRYCAIAALALLLTAAAVVAVNAAIDPFAMTQFWERSGVNARKPAIHQRVRLTKAYGVRQVQPEAIVLGTSRSHIGLRMDHPGWTAAPRYNLAFDGATTYEMYAYLVHAHSLRPLRQVVLGLDTWHLAPTAPSGGRAGFDPDILLASGGLPAHLRMAAADLRVLASIDTLAASLRTLEEQDDDEPEWLAPDGQRLGDAFFRRAGEIFHDDSPRAYFEAYDRDEAAWQAPPPKTAKAAPPAIPGATSPDWIRRIVDFCRRESIDLRIYITPAHAHQLEMARAAGDWPRLEADKRDLVAFLAEDAARHPGKPPVPLWDFSGYSSVTTEALPTPGSRAEMRYYWDSSHFKAAVGDWVLDRLFAVADAANPPPPDFGVRLTPANVEEALATAAAARADYVHRHPDEVAAIAALVMQSRASPRP